MGDSRPSHGTGGENILLVGLFGFLDTIGGHQDGPGKLIKFLLLVLPGSAIVAVKMGKPLLEFGISVGRQHLTMGVNHNPFSLACL